MSLTTVNAGSTCYVTAAFKDKTGAAATPDTATWRAIDKASNTELQAETALTPGSSVEITIPGAVNEIIGVDPVADTETRRIIVTATYAGGETATAYYDYLIQNLER